jgi:hypothetical protein
MFCVIAGGAVDHSKCVTTAYRVAAGDARGARGDRRLGFEGTVLKHL